jgi:hypothetical protein
MLKPVIAATALLAIAGSSLVYAQQRYGDHDGFGNGGPRAEHRHRLSAEDRSAFADARIAALKAGLELTPDQAKNWPAFEGALRNMVQLRIQRMQARQAREQAGDQQTQTPTNPFDRLASRADNMTKRSAALKQIADTGAPLYQSLNDAQKARFTMLASILRPHHNQHANNGGNLREGQGYGRDGRGQDGQGQGSGHGGRRFGQQDGQGEGRGWGHGGRRFGQDDGRGPGGRMQNLMGSDDGDQGSQL